VKNKTICATGWSLGREKGKVIYSLWVESSMKNKTELSKLCAGWKQYGCGYRTSTNEKKYIYMFKRAFATIPAWRKHALKLSFAVCEINEKTGTLISLNTKKY